MEPKIFIIVLNWNGKNDTLECLASLRKLAYGNFQTVVVDNGSKDGSVEVIRQQFSEITLIETRENLGFAEGNNVGIRHALKNEADAILLLNNDTVADPQMLDAFASSMNEHPYAGILGAKIYLFEERNKFDHLGGRWNAKKASFDLIGLRQVDDGKNWEKMEAVDYVCGAALLARREVFETVGLLEPKFFLIWEESDFCFRAKKAGFNTMTCPKAIIWHKVSASMVGGKPHSTYFWWRNRLLWIERNCTKLEKFRIFLMILFPDILHIYKLHMLKTFQLYLLKIIRPRENLKKRKEKILKYKAALHGVRDYFFRRFGNGPSWIYGRGE